MHMRKQLIRRIGKDMYKNPKMVVILNGHLFRLSDIFSIDTNVKVYDTNIRHRYYFVVSISDGTEIQRIEIRFQNEQDAYKSANWLSGIWVDSSDCEPIHWLKIIVSQWCIKCLKRVI